MTRYDRLTTLIDRFRLAVTPAAPGAANLVVLAGAAGAPALARLSPASAATVPEGAEVIFGAEVAWSGADNPLVAALPATFEVDLAADAESRGLVALMRAELAARRCGADLVLARLGEVLVVRMMRARIEAGSTEPGLLGGLADPRLSRALVAMHDAPGRDWRAADLAAVAGMSRSRFAEAFAATVGEPPAAYLRRWRLTLARQDLGRGHRVEAVARRYGFASPDGFSRAFRRRFGASPIDARLGRAAGAG